MFEHSSLDLSVFLCLDEVVADTELVVELLPDRFLVARVERLSREGDLALVETGLLAAVAAHQVLVEDDRFLVVTGVDVGETEVVQHLDRLGVATLVARERLEEVVRALRCAAHGVDRDQVTTRCLRELGRVRQVVVLVAVLDDLLELVQRVRVLALVPVDVRELVARVAVHLVVGRRELDHFHVGRRGQIPLRGITLRLLEEELAEREVGVRDVGRLRRLLDQLVVDRAGVLVVALLLVLVREVVEHLVELRVVRVVGLHHRVVRDGLIAGCSDDLGCLSGVVPELGRVLLLGLRVLRLDVRRDLVALRGASSST